MKSPLKGRRTPLPTLPTLLLLLQTSLQAQPDWREQPKWFSIGVTVGLAGGNKTNPGTLTAGAALSKTAYDLQRGAKADPITAGYGAFIGASTRIKLKKRKKDRKL